jgi:uncharacterized membrane protein YfcA
VVVPVLIQLHGVSVQTAIASSLFAYMFVGLAGGYMYLRRQSVTLAGVGWLVAGTLPGAFGGAFLLRSISDLVVKFVLYGVVLVTSALSAARLIRQFLHRRTERQRHAEPPARPSPAPSTAPAVGPRTASYLLAVHPAGEQTGVCGGSENGAWRNWGLQLALGFVVGGLSALTGTSGPVCLLPALIALRWDIHEALGWVLHLREATDRYSCGSLSKQGGTACTTANRLGGHHKLGCAAAWGG